jgi:hypothetical protein
MKSNLAVAGGFALAWLLTGTIIGLGQQTASPPDSFPGINITLPSGEVQVLTLGPTDMPELKKLSDAQLEIVINALDATPTIPFAELPKNGEIGNFFSLQHPDWPPLPFNSSKSSVWDFGNFYLLNDVNYAYEPSTAKAMMVSDGAQAQAQVSGLPAPGGGGTNAAPRGVPYPPPNYGTNLFISQVNVSGGSLNGIASNTISDVEYQIFSATNLLQPVSNWFSESVFYGSEVTNWTAFSVAQGNRTDLFIQLLSWQSDDGSGLPNWWELEFFGSTGIDPYADPMGDGWSNWQKFLNNWNPHQFYTPPTPQGVTVVFNATNSNRHCDLASFASARHELYD